MLSQSEECEKANRMAVNAEHLLSLLPRALVICASQQQVKE